MRRIFRLSAIVLAIASLTVATVKAESILPPPEKVSDHVYAWIGPLGGPNEQNRGYRMNLAFVVGGEAVAVFDTGYTRAMAEEMIAHIAKVTPLPIRYAVSTNSQPHRHFGNDAFRAAGAEVIATPEEAARMADMGGMFEIAAARALGLKPGAVVSPKAPDSLIATPRALDLGGGVVVRATPVGGNHTPNSLIAEVPGDKVVYAGDVLCGGRLLGVLDVSDTAHWIKAYDGLRRFAGYTFIPGHGRPGPLATFERPTYGYLTDLYRHMLKAAKAGVGLDRAVKGFDQSAYADLANFKELAGRNASWAYQQAEFAAFE